MAFVGMEDMQGAVDLVVFPRAWEEARELVQYDRVIIVEGRVDSKRGEPKILVDKISTEATWVAPKEEGELPAPVKEKPKREYKVPASAQPMPVAEPAAGYAWANNDMPPPPEPFPEDWGQDFEDQAKEEKAPETPSAAEIVAAEQGAVIAEQPEPAVMKPEEEEPVKGGVTQTDQPAPAPDITPVEEPQESVETPLLPAIPPEEKRPPKAGDRSRQMITVVLRSLDDKARDILRIRRIHGMLISYPGNDQFALYVIERSRGYRLEFPNDTTGINEELLARLEGIVGKENVIVEPITYQ
jgi:DNA polymerase-3 subunit alpha